MKETKKSPVMGFLMASLILNVLLLTSNGYYIRATVNSANKCSTEKQAIQVMAASKLEAANAAHAADMERYNETFRDLIYQVNNLKKQASEQK